MQSTSRAIVLNQVKYGESSIIARMYTEKSGLQSFMIRGARSKKSKIRSAHLQHLTLVEIESSHRPNKDLQHLKNLKIAHPFRDIPFNMKKSAVVVFLNEILNKVIREEEPNPNLFGFLYNSIQFLDLKEGSVALFHPLFLIILSKFLGFYPRNNYSETRQIFDLEAGEFTSLRGPENLFAPPPASLALTQLLDSGIEHLDALKMVPETRKLLMDLLLNYYRLHVPGLNEIKSYAVLQEVFD